MADTCQPLGERLAAIEKAADAKLKTKAVANTKGRGKGLMAKMMEAREAPHGTTGPIAERPYSVQRASAYAAGMIGADAAKEEIHAHTVLKGMYGGANWHYMGKSFLIPFATDMIPTNYGSDNPDTDPRKAEFVATIRTKMLAGVAGADPDEVTWLRKKAGGGLVNKTFGTLSDAAGGSLVPFPTLGELIEVQRNAEVFSRCGATEMPLPPNGRISFPKQTGVTTAYMVGEGQADTASDPTTGMLNLEAKKMMLTTTLNGELFKFASPAAEALVRGDYAAVGARKMDQQQLEGTGGTQVLGLLNYQTQTSWAQGNPDKVIVHTAKTTGTDGDTFSFEDPALMQGKLPDSVDDDGKTAWVMRKLLFAYLRNRRADGTVPGDGRGAALFNVMGKVDEVRGGSRETLDNIKVVKSNTVSNTRTKGSGTALTYVLLGYFRDWITARYGVMEILANPWGDTAFTNDQVVIRGIQRFDAGARHAASFVLCDSLLIA